MQIYVGVKNKEYATKFIPRVLKTYIKKRFNITKGKHLDTYLKSIGVKQGVRELLIYATDTLKAYKRKDGYMLEIDKNKIPIGSPYNIDTLVKLIGNGTANVRGYSLLEDAIDYVYKNKKTLMLAYAANQRTKERKG